MNYLKKLVLVGSLTAFTGLAFAAPSKLITANHTQSSDVFAKVAGNPPTDPIKPGTNRERHWGLVRTICAMAGQLSNCSAELLVTKNGQTLSLGVMTMNLSSGQITPDHVELNGFKVQTSLTNGEVHIDLYNQ